MLIPMNLTPIQQDLLLDLARQTIRQTLSPSSPSWPVPTPDSLLSQPAGCFVTLHHHDTHQLRGCIGRLQSEDSLLETVRSCSQSVLEDPRFITNPVTLAELPQLDLEITILSPLQPAQNILDFDVLNNGIYLRFGDRAGCFLPQVARETGWTKEQLLDRLCTEKMGLSPLTWRNPHARLFKFTAMILGPVPFQPA